MGNNDISKNGARSNLWNSNLFCVIIGVLLGTLLGVFGTWGTDYIRDCKAKSNLKQIISCDIEATKSRFDLFFKVHSCNKFIKKSHDPEWAPNISDYDTSVFDAYIHKIPLLPKDSAKRILLFYSNLKVINEAKYILQNNKSSDMSPESREVWAKVIYEGSDNTNKIGEKILRDFKGEPTKQLSTTFIELKPDGSYQLKAVETSAASSTID